MPPKMLTAVAQNVTQSSAQMPPKYINVEHHRVFDTFGLRPECRQNVRPVMQVTALCDIWGSVLGQFCSHRLSTACAGDVTVCKPGRNIRAQLGYMGRIFAQVAADVPVAVAVMTRASQCGPGSSDIGEQA